MYPQRIITNSALACSSVGLFSVAQPIFLVFRPPKFSGSSDLLNLAAKAADVFSEGLVRTGLKGKGRLDLHSPVGRIYDTK